MKQYNISLKLGQWWRRRPSTASGKNTSTTPGSKTFGFQTSDFWPAKNPLPLMFGDTPASSTSNIRPPTSNSKKSRHAPNLPIRTNTGIEQSKINKGKETVVDDDGIAHVSKKRALTRHIFLWRPSSHWINFFDVLRKDGDDDSHSFFDQCHGNTSVMSTYKLTPCRLIIYHEDRLLQY